MCAESKPIRLAFDWLQQSLTRDSVNFDVRVQLNGEPGGGSTSANAIFRLANKFSMRYYQSSFELGGCRAPLHTNQFVSYSDVLIP